MSKLKDILETVGSPILAIALCLIGLWLGLWILTILNFTFSNLRDDSRCMNLGYDSSDVVIHYPKFWHGEGYCYGGQATQKGVKL